LVPIDDLLVCTRRECEYPKDGDQIAKLQRGSPLRTATAGSRPSASTRECR
jgi:hypothetical protein